jgi:hypothetical protein
MAAIELVDFETGDLSQLDYYYGAGSNVVQAISGVKYSGSYGGDCAFDGSSDACFGQIDFTAQDEVYVTAYLRINNVYSNDGYWEAFEVSFSGNYLIRLVFNASLALIRIYYWNGTEMVYDDSFTNGFTWSVDTWYKFKAHIVRASGELTSDGSILFTIDGTEIWSKANLDNWDYQINRVKIGNELSGVAGSGSHFYFDDVGIYDSDPDAGGVILQAYYYMNQRG